MDNKKMNRSKILKKDDFYTRRVDIERELANYTDQFKDKIVLCNCDNPYESQFFKYFFRFFNVLGLKELIVTSYPVSPIAGTQITLFDDPIPPPSPPARKIELTSTEGIFVDDEASMRSLIESKSKLLHADDFYCEGDFRSAECISLLEKADIVVTNPPFSLFGEYVSLLFQYEKDFLIIGNKMAVTQKEFFQLWKNQKIWTGYREFAGGMLFYVPNGCTCGHRKDQCFDRCVCNSVAPCCKCYDYVGTDGDDKGKFIKNVATCWWTNLYVKKRYEPYPIEMKYTPEKYQKYDNYDAINIDEIKDIPDYDGIMGVPATFPDKYNPEQFEIVGNEYDLKLSGGRGYINGKRMAPRIFIRLK